MAAILWGKVYYRDVPAGELRQERDRSCVFTYDQDYLAGGGAAIAHTLPRRAEPFVSHAGLHPFFDNLVAEGWLRNAQARALGVSSDDRFALLLAFGRDCAGAVSLVDPAPAHEPALDRGDAESVAALASRASLSGIQPKLFAVADGKSFRPAKAGETSTHIAKLPSGSLRDIVEIEHVTTEAMRALLPGDDIVQTRIAGLSGLRGKALLVRRFDRTPAGRKLHFEEFSQLLGKPSGDAKYDGAYEDMARFIRETPGCVPVEAERLFRRVLACILTGNTDAHFKNFAMMHTAQGLRLAPAYDLVASALYPEYQQLALAAGGARNLDIGALKPKHVVAIGEGFGLPAGAIELAVRDMGRQLPAARRAIEACADVPGPLKTKLNQFMEKRWNGTFDSTGRLLSKRRSAAERN